MSSADQQSLAPRTTTILARRVDTTGFDLVTGDDDLRSLLDIHPPGEPEQSPPIFSFQRQRGVELDWLKVVGGVRGIRSGGSVTALRVWFEQSWGLHKAIDEITESDLSDVLYRDGFIKSLAKDLPNDELKAPPAWLPTFPGPDSGHAQAVPVEEGIVLTHGLSGRRYLVRLVSSQKLEIAEFKKPKTYAAAWEDKIDGVELVFSTDAEAGTFFTQFSEIDLRPAVISRRDQELRRAKEEAKIINETLPSLDGARVEKILDSGGSLDEVAELQQRYVRLKLAPEDLQRERERLASIAENMGLILALEKRPIMHADGKTVLRTLEPGKIYKPVDRSVSWTTQHTRIETSYQTLLGFRIPSRHERAYTRRHTAVVTDYREIDTSVDVLARWRDEYLKAHPGAEIFVFRRAGSRFVSVDDVPLKGIIQRCEIDEEFRRRCVVLLPIYDQALTGQRAIIKCHVFERPLAGVSPTSLPRLSIEEQLSYRMVWDGVALGELMSSVNLAPGERRTIHISKQFQQETTVTRTEASVFDINRAESNDLAAEMENQARQEQESSNNFQTSVSVSGGAFGVTAEASASAGVSASLKEFGQSISRVAKKAAQSVTQQNRHEVSTSSTARTSVTTTDETTAEIRNVNEGRTLNLMFYRLYNRHQGGLYLDGLQFHLVPSVEIIANSGVYEAETFAFGELSQMLVRLRDMPLPFDLDAEAIDSLEQTAMEQIANLMGAEYADPADDDRTLTGADRSMRVLRFRFEPPRPARRSAATTEMLDAWRRGLTDALQTALANLRANERKEEINLLVGSRALYLDARVGLREGTEPYSELMRTREVMMRDAEIFAKEAEGVLARAQARRIGRLSGQEAGVWLTALKPDLQTEKALVLGLSGPLPGGEWRLFVDSKPMKQVPAAFLGARELIFDWSEAQSWLNAPDLIWRVELGDKSGLAITFPPARGKPLSERVTVSGEPSASRAGRP